MASRQQSSTCDSCGLPFDAVLRHVPLRDAAWICWYCLRHVAVQRQYAPRLAVKLKGMEADSQSHASIPGVYRCSLGSRCLRAEARKGYPISGNGRYCSVACQGRARAIVQQKPAAVMVEV